MNMTERTEIPGDVLRSVSEFLDNYSNQILLRKSGVIAMNKPAGIAMTDKSAFFSSGLVDIAQDCEEKHLRPVNRLDRDTSGTVLLAEDRSTARYLARQFEARTVNKTYLALLTGEFPKNELEVNLPLLEISNESGRMHVEVNWGESAKRARTGFKRLAVLEDSFGTKSSLVAVELYTGRTHQIRVHSASTGHSVVGDSVYGIEDADSRQMLHSHTTRLFLPGEELTTITAPIPSDFRTYLMRRNVVSGQGNIATLIA